MILVEVRDAEADSFIMSRLSDGLGYAAFVDLAPGRYKVFVPDDARVTGRRVEVVTRGGRFGGTLRDHAVRGGPRGPEAGEGDDSRVRSDGGAGVPRDER